MNVLIIEKDIRCCDKIIKVLNKSFNLKFCVISSYYDEIDNFIKRFNFSIILIDNDLKNDFKDMLKKYSNIMIIINSKESRKKDDYIYVDETDSSEDIILKINKILNLDNFTLRDKIKSELKYLGYNPKYYGSKYISEAIYHILTHKEKYTYESNLEKDVYPIIAKKYNKSVNTIKCNIIHATDIMICECEENKLLDYLGYYDFSKPGPKKIMESIILKLLN